MTFDGRGHLLETGPRRRRRRRSPLLLIRYRDFVEFRQDDLAQTALIERLDVIGGDAESFLKVEIFAKRQLLLVVVVRIRALFLLLVLIFVFILLAPRLRLRRLYRVLRLLRRQVLLQADLRARLLAVLVLLD